MHLGIAMFPTDYTIGPVQLARAVEERGFESLFVPEHTHIPASRLTPYPGPQEDLPPEYSHVMSPVVALSAAAAVTTRLRLGFGVSLVVEHDPIALAKEVATLDFISDGRVIFGVGAGWNREEMENHGTDYHTRFSLMRERVEAMRRIWADEAASYHGRFVDFDEIWSWPKPVQRPGPPVLIGGHGEKALQRVVEWGDGWIPLSIEARKELPAQVEQLQRMAAEAGREPIEVTLFGARQRAETLERLEKIGVARAVFWLDPGTADELHPQLDALAELL